MTPPCKDQDVSMASRAQEILRLHNLLNFSSSALDGMKIIIRQGLHVGINISQVNYNIFITIKEHLEEVIDSCKRQIRQLSQIDRI